MDRRIEHTLNVSYWNANSIRTKIFELYEFMKDYEVDIFCIQETMLKESDNLHSHPEYFMYRNDRPTEENQRAAGGVAILIRRSIKHELIPLPRLRILEALGLELRTITGAKIQIWSIYLPGSTTSSEIQQHFRSDLMKLVNRNCSYFINGDFNAKHRHWNCIRANTAGNILFNELQRQNFLLMHSSEPTHHSSCSNASPSTIDLTLTNGIHNTTDFETYTTDSDHSIISYSIKVNEPINQRPTKKIPLFKNADWLTYQSIMHNKLTSQPSPELSTIVNTQQIDDMIKTLTNSMIDAQKVVVPLVTPVPYAVILTPEIKSMIQSRNRLRRQVQRNPGLAIHLRWPINHFNRMIKSSINEIVNANFSHMLSQIKQDDNYHQLWKTARFLKNRQKQIPPLKVESRSVITPIEKCKLLAHQFKINHDNPLKHDNASHTRLVNSTVSRFIQNSASVDPSIENATELEIQQIVKNLKPAKAPGLDRVHNSLIKRLPPIGYVYLALIINACFKLTYFPKEWKSAKVIAIKKPGKPPSQPSSYRPISLLSSLSKILERVILARLNKHLEENNILPHQQHGFRSGHSTITQLNSLTQNIKQSLINRLSTGMILMDIEKAFDRVWHNGLVYKLICINSPQYLTKIVHSFLQFRKFQVAVDNSMSEQIQIEYGVPQGAVLSPTLYSIYIYDIPTPTDCQLALFADDTAFFTSSRYCKTITRIIEKTAKRLYKYYTRWKIKINQDKTQAIFFSKRRTKQLPRTNFKFVNTDVPWEQNAVKYLGIYLDRRLTFKQHIEHAIKKASQAMKIVYSLLNRKSKLNLSCKTLLYKMAIRPILTYGAPILNNMANVHKRRLQITQNKTLRMILNVPWDTSTIQIHEDTKMEIITDFMDKLTVNFHNRMNIQNA